MTFGVAHEPFSPERGQLMSLRFASFAFSVVVVAFSTVVAAFSARAQLPPDQKLSAEDERGLNEELERLQKLLSTANDKATIEMQIANTYAASDQFSAAIGCLRKIVWADIGFDPSRAIDFRRLRGTAEFESIMDDVRRQTPPVHSSRVIATLHTCDITYKGCSSREHGFR